MSDMPRSRSNSRDRILDAAADIVRAVGAGRLTLEAVAERAGLSKGGLLYNFPSKEALLRAMIQRMVDENMARRATVRAGLAGRSNIEARSVMALHFSERCVDQRDVAMGLLAAISENPSLLEPVRTVVAAEWAAMRGADDPAASMLAWLALEGLHSLDLFGISPLDDADEAAVAAAMERLLDGVLLPAAGGRAAE